MSRICFVDAGNVLGRVCIYRLELVVDLKQKNNNKIMMTDRVRKQNIL